MAEMSPLRRRMIEDMTVRNLSPATQRSYVYAVAKFSRYFGSSPDRLGLEDVRAYQVHLASNGISWPASTRRSARCGSSTASRLARAEMPERIAYAREPRKLPVVLSAEEVVVFSKLFHRSAAISTLLAAARPILPQPQPAIDRPTGRLSRSASRLTAATAITRATYTLHPYSAFPPVAAWFRDRSVLASLFVSLPAPTRRHRSAGRMVIAGWDAVELPPSTKRPDSRSAISARYERPGRSKLVLFLEPPSRRL